MSATPTLIQYAHYAPSGFYPSVGHGGLGDTADFGFGSPQEPLLEALDGYTVLRHIEFQPLRKQYASCALLGFSPCTSRLLRTPTSARSTPQPLARSSTRLFDPSSEDLCVALGTFHWLQWLASLGFVGFRRSCVFSPPPATRIGIASARCSCTCMWIRT
jgi:hypothetical protein